MRHIISERTARQNSRWIDRNNIVIRDLALQKLIDMIAMAESISSRRDMTSQARTLNKLSKSGSVPNHKIWFDSIFRMRMACPSNEVLEVADMLGRGGNNWMRKLVGLNNRANSIGLNKQSERWEVLRFRRRNRELGLRLSVGCVWVQPDFGVSEWARACGIAAKACVDIHKSDSRMARNSGDNFIRPSAEKSPFVWAREGLMVTLRDRNQDAFMHPIQVLETICLVIRDIQAMAIAHMTLVIGTVNGA